MATKKATSVQTDIHDPKETPIEEAALVLSLLERAVALGLSGFDTVVQQQLRAIVALAKGIEATESTLCQPAEAMGLDSDAGSDPAELKATLSQLEKALSSKTRQGAAGAESSAQPIQQILAVALAAAGETLSLAAQNATSLSQLQNTLASAVVEVGVTQLYQCSTDRPAAGKASRGKSAKKK